MKFKSGDEITAVYPLDSGGRGVTLMRIKKVGRKYLHGITLSRNPDGTIREGHQAQITTENSTIYPGLRHDLRDAEFKHRLDVQKWKRLKQTQRDGTARDFWGYARERMDEWEVENPMPQPPELPTPEASQ